MVATRDATITLDRDDRGGPGRLETPALFLVLRCGQPRADTSRHLLADTDIVRIGRGSQGSVERSTEDGKRVLRIILADRSVSSDHARLQPQQASWMLRDRGSKNGSIVDGAEAKAVTLRDGALIEIGETLLIYRAALTVAEGSPPDCTAVELQGASGFATLVPSLERSFAQLRALAPSSATVMLCGRSGTGKEVAARAVHALSQRSGRFVAVNCAALPDALLESQLFGHRRGAFTGANDEREGLIAAASGGTLFLDEIGELTPRAQAVLLRALQEREVMPLGSTEAQPVDLRLLVASNRDLDAMVAQQEFREDLLARISDMRVTLPALRDRREDLGLLIASLLERQPASASRVTFTTKAARALFRYSWPRNIRQLAKCLKTASLLAPGGQIDREHLASELRGRDDDGAAALSDSDRQLRGELVKLLSEHAGNVTRVAEAMGKKRQQIQKWCKRFGLDPSEYR